jgi:hypothetical protein
VDIQVQKTFKTPNRQTTKITYVHHTTFKTLRIHNNEGTFKAARENYQVTYEGKPIRKIADFSTETLKTRRAWNSAFQALKRK